MDKNITFEEALADLEKIVRSLESGEVSLDDSIEMFENGVELSKICSEKLKNAQQKVEMLVTDINGDKKAESFYVND